VKTQAIPAVVITAQIDSKNRLASTFDRRRDQIPRKEVGMTETEYDWDDEASRDQGNRDEDTADSGSPDFGRDRE
jgi:hypothetical protein